MWRRSVRYRSVVAALLGATIIVLTLDLRTNLIGGMSAQFAEVVGVFQSGVRTVVRPIEGFASGITDFARLRSENRRLREENESLRRQTVAVQDVARENARLRQLIQLEQTLDLDTVRARVIGASLSGVEKSATIDRGRNAGISQDLAVLAAEGLVGRVSWAGDRSARVQLLTDPQSAIGVRIDRNGETGVVNGTGRSLLRLELVERAALDLGAVRKNDVVLTSGYQGGLFPPGIPIGVVQEVNLAERGTAYQILVRPFVRLSRLDVVSVAARPDTEVNLPSSELNER